jgi:hypothetical protein
MLGLLSQYGLNRKRTELPPESMRRWERGGEEPSLEELLFDPVVESVLKRDGLTREDVMAVMEAARRRAGGRNSQRLT